MGDVFKQTITFEWWCNDSKLQDYVDMEEFEEQLEQHALERIRTMRDEFYTGGELQTTCVFEGMEADVSGYWQVYKDNDRGNGKEAVILMVPTEDVARVKKLVKDYLESDMKELMDHKIDQHK